MCSIHHRTTIYSKLLSNNDFSNSTFLENIDFSVSNNHRHFQKRSQLASRTNPFSPQFQLIFISTFRAAIRANTSNLLIPIYNVFKIKLPLVYSQYVFVVSNLKNTSTLATGVSERSSSTPLLIIIIFLCCYRQFEPFTVSLKPLFNNNFN